MATMQYSSEYISSALGLNASPNIAVSGGGGAVEIIDSVIVEAFLSTSAAVITFSVTCTVVFSGGTASKTQNVNFNSENAGGYTVNFTMPSMTAEQANSITSITLYCTDSRIFVKHTQYVTVTYSYVTACGALTTVGVDNAYPVPGDTTILSGIGASAGTNNAITGYAIYRSLNGGSYGYLTTVYTSATSFAIDGLAIPANIGDYYTYKIITVGTHAGYDSGYSDAIDVTTTSLYCTAPTVITLSATTTATPPLMTWGGARAGAGNAITEYEIQYQESPDGTTWGDWTALKTVPATSGGGSTAVAIAETRGYYRRYRIKTHGELGSDYYSDWSAVSAKVRTKRSTVAQMRTPQLIVYEYPHIVNGVEMGPYPLGMIGGYNTLIWRTKYQGVSECSLLVPFDERTNALLQCGNLIGIAGRNELMRITTTIIGRGENDGVETVEVHGKSLVSLLGMRVVTYSTQGENTPVGLIKSMLRNQPVFLDTYNAGIGDYLPDVNGDLADDDHGDRRFPDFHWKAPAFDYESSDTVTYQPELLGSLMDAVIALCKIEGCGLRVVADYYTEYADTLTLWLELYKGTDRSTGQDANPHVVFDEILGNVGKQTYTRSIENLRTAGYATNDAVDTLSGTDKRLVDITSENPYTAGDQGYINGGNSPAGAGGGSGMNRSELGLTVTDVTTPTSGTADEKVQALYGSVRRIGRNNIAAAAEELAFEATLNTDVGPQYLTDYDTGDMVTVRNGRYGVTMDARLAEAQETYEPGKKVQVALTLGDPAVTLLGRMKQIARRRG